MLKILVYIVDHIMQRTELTLYVYILSWESAFVCIKSLSDRQANRPITTMPRVSSWVTGLVEKCKRTIQVQGLIQMFKII